MNRLLVPLFALLVSCAAPEDVVDMDAIARDYLFLELSMGRHDAAHVDAYFGPESLRERADAEALTLDAILSGVDALSARLDSIDAGGDADTATRIAGLAGRLQALAMRIAITKGETVDFDAESAALFGSVAPDYDAAHFEALLARVDALLPGEGPLAERVDAFNAAFVTPPNRMDAVFQAAIDECRRRTLEYIDLPANESFSIEYVNDKPWTGYNWYQGGAHSLIQLNTDFPMSISRAVDLGCHEGYPGHHTFNALIEAQLVDDRGWIEYSLYPLFSPQSLIAEGSGNYGIDLAFPGDERRRFEVDVLFPLAGLSTDDVDLYYELSALTAALDFADNEAARDYLNGTISREEAADWIRNFELTSGEKALQRTRFFDAYRSYVINYNHGKALVADYVESGAADQAERWARFEALLTSPVFPGR